VSRVLILSQPHDIHAYAIAEMIHRKGGEAVIWQTTNFPLHGTETVAAGPHGVRFRVHGPAGDVDFSRPFDAVWRRRPAYRLDRSAVHPADYEFADLGARNLREGMFYSMLEDAFWVNPMSAMKFAEYKIPQILWARELGLEVPETLFTNDPDEIRAFMRAQGGKIAFKPFRSQPWIDGDQYYMAYTAIITEDELVRDELLMAAPAIYQQIVHKAYELRCTFIGERCFAAKVLSQQTRFGKVDWRKSYGELQMEPYELPAEIQEKCRALMRRYGIVFGCFDFIVTEDGRYVFLEVNPTGQFLFVESYTDQRIGDAFAEMLVQCRTDFAWPHREPIRYLDVAADAGAKMEADAAIHTPAAQGGWRDSVAV